MCIDKTLEAPARTFLSRTGKGIRAQLIHIGAELAGGMAPLGRGAVSPGALENASLIVELLHAGSLIIDDIQDGSAIRRDGPAMHCVYGVPIALNVGNWLYFASMEKISALGLCPQAELCVYRLWNRTLLRAHQGQALDLGTTITEVPQAHVRELCWHAMQLKTGALMGFALQLGAMLGGASVEAAERIGAWGERFGIVLQMFNDLDNLCPSPRQYEDLAQKRPTWFWSVASYAPDRDYAALITAVAQLPMTQPVASWLESHGLPARAHVAAEVFARRLLTAVDAPAATSEALHRIVQRLAHGRT
jgi:geranylgeranyl pyrophosphate synthase